MIPWPMDCSSSRLKMDAVLWAQSARALAAKTDNENKALRQRISELDERAVAREKSRADAAERKAQEQTRRGDREEKRANEA